MTMVDRAGKSHWDSTWESAGAPKQAPNVEGPGRWNHVNRGIARFLRSWLRVHGPKAQLAELGCARSVWLPFFSSELGYEVTGIDYSELGCELSRTVLADAKVEGRVVLADFFDPPAELLNHFQAVFSFGVAEHFNDTAGCISAFSKFLAPGGRLVTIIPNMTGVPGFLQKHLNAPVFDKHVPLDREGLMSAHRSAGLNVLEAGYLFSTNFGILNLNGLRQREVSYFPKRIFAALLSRVSLVGWLAEPWLPPPTGAFAGYVYCVADKH